MTVRFSASSAARLMACPASADLESAIPGWIAPVVDRNKGAKGKGTLIHKAFDITDGWSTSDLRQYVRALEYYLSVKETRRFKEMSEVTFEATWLQSKPNTTVDRVLYLSDELHIFDWKTGVIPVDVQDNEQLLFYAACAISLAPNAKGVWLHIVQPWANNMEAVFVTVKELAQFMNDARAAEAKILAGDHTFGPSDHCKFCPANPHSRVEKASPYCPAMMDILYPSRPINEQELLEDL